jgi:AAA+ superfamily predicted ATPase
MNIKDKELLPQYFDDGFFHSVVLVTNGNKPDFKQGEIKERIGENHFKLKGLRDEQAVELIRKRIGDIDLISDGVIKKVFQRSKNPRQLLEDVEDLLRDAVENNKDEIKEEDISSVLDSGKKVQPEIQED